MKPSTKDLEEYIKQYELGEVEEITSLPRGLNYSYLIKTAKEKYVFRVYRHQWRSLEDILYEVNILNHLSSKGNISYPISNHDGNFVTEIKAEEKVLYGVLFTFAEGEIPPLDEASSFELGQILAKIHNNSDEFDNPNKRSYGIDLHHLIEEPLRLLDGVLEKHLSTESVEFIKGFASFLKKEIRQRNLEIGFCHGDLHDWNVHQYQDFFKVFDFDCCGEGYRAHDLAIFLWNLKLNYPQKEESCWKGFKKGYLNVRQLKEEDLDSIPLFVAARRYWLAGILFKNPDVFGTEWISPAGLGMFLKQLKEDVEVFGFVVDKKG